MGSTGGSISTRGDFSLTSEHLQDNTHERDREPIALGGGHISIVDQFPYLGSLIASSGRIDMDVNRGVARARSGTGSKGFWSIEECMSSWQRATKRSVTMHMGCLFGLMAKSAGLPSQNI